MLYVKAGFKDDKILYIGEAETLSKAVRYADNIGDIFSDGPRGPSTVVVSIVNAKDTVLYSAEVYNGYINKVYSDETMLAIYG